MPEVIVPGLLEFEEKCFERIWGGQKLRAHFGMNTPDGNVGEAWLVADHQVHESVVADGPCAGMTLTQLLTMNPEAILGRVPKRTIHGRFPLMLKILDAREALSVQVHPDDETAKRLGEPDVGKTEMWYVLQADPGSELICGLAPDLRLSDLRKAAESGEIERFMARHRVSGGEAMFVEAGSVHAIGAGLVLAEIQQNSDLTYRIYDWNRSDAEGRPRQLHLDKSLEAIHFGAPPPTPGSAREYQSAEATVGVLAACPLFAAERIQINGNLRRAIQGRSFHILLAESGSVQVDADDVHKNLSPRRAIMVCGKCEEFALNGSGSLLDYYVPNIQAEIVEPLRRHGVSDDAISKVVFV